MSELTAFNTAPPDVARAQLRPSCASDRWLDELVTARPYPDLAAVQRKAADALAALDWADVEQALAAHPRIGQRPAGSGTEAAWSRTEQAGAATATADTTEALRAGNAEYERRFGLVFLICATGRSAAEMVQQLHTRLEHDVDTEHAVIRDELAKIVALRLARTFAEPATISTHVLDAVAGRPAAGVAVTLEQRSADGWRPINTEHTDGDGRIANLAEVEPGVYRLTFDTEGYLTDRVAEVFYPEVGITVRIAAGHTHVPLLLSPFAYSTYRGS